MTQTEMFHLLRSVQGGLLRTGAPDVFFSSTCVLKATNPPSWSHAVLKTPHMEMVLACPTIYDINQRFEIGMAPQADGDFALLVNHQIVHQHAKLFQFNLSLFGKPCHQMWTEDMEPLRIIYRNAIVPTSAANLRN